MKAEHSRQLDRLIMQQRLRRIAIGIGIGVSILAFMLFMGYRQQTNVDPVIGTARRHGVILNVKRMVSGYAAYRLIVRLDDGRAIRTASMRSAGIPYVGEKLELTEMAHKSGRKTYRLLKLIK